MIGLKNFACAALALVAWFGAPAAQAQSAAFPAAPVKIIVPWPAGGSQDVSARVLAERMGADLGQPVIVDNRPGASGGLGAQVAARSKPDGYTIFQLSVSHLTAPVFQKNLSYDWQRDFTPLYAAYSVPMVLFVPASSKVRNVAQLVDLAKETPGGLSYGSGGGGISVYLPVFVVQALKLNATHVPFKGIAASTQAVAGDQVHFAFASVADVGQLAKAGKLRVIGVATEQRLPDFPDVPTLAEQGVKVTGSSWGGYAVPAGTPPDVAEKLAAAFSRASADPAVRERLASIGMAYRPRNAAEFNKFMHDEANFWRRVIEENNIKE